MNTKKCLGCGIILKSYKFSHQTKRCRKCYYKWNKGKNNSMFGRKGENHPCWKGGFKSREHFCKDCGKSISDDAERCILCSGKIRSQRQKGINNSSYKDGRTLIKHYCIEPNCKKEISLNNFRFGKKRCKECYYKWIKIPQNNSNYKNGSSLEQHYCIEFNCKNKISLQNWYYGNKRCKSCARKEDWRTPSFLINFRKSHKGKRAKEKSNFWKGGITKLNNNIRSCLKSTDWAKLILKRDNYTCQKCFKRGGKLVGHHKKSFSKIFEEFRYLYFYLDPKKDKNKLLKLSYKYIPFWDTNNGITLCEKCHRQTDSYLKG